MTGDDISTIGLLVIGITFLWKGIAYLLDMFITKGSDKADDTSSKIDTALNLLQEQSVKMEKLSTQMEHSYATTISIQRKEEELRGKVYSMSESIVELKEWKRNATSK